MYYDTKTVVFGINSLLFFVDMVSYTCKLFTHQDQVFSGVFRTSDNMLVQQLQKNIGEDRKLINYKDQRDFYILAESPQTLYTHKSKLRLCPDSSITVFQAQSSLTNPDVFRLKVLSCSKEACLDLAEYYSTNNIPLTMESHKIGHQMKLLTWKHTVISKTSEMIEMVHFDVKTLKREFKRKVFNKGTMKLQKTILTNPDKKFLILFYIMNGYRLVYRIYNFEDNSLSSNFVLVNDTGPNEFLKIEDNLDFIINFRFSGILQGNFLQYCQPQLIPNTAHMFLSNMTSYDVELDCYYKLQEEYLSTRLEQISFVEEQPKTVLQSPGLKKMQSACDNVFEKTLRDLDAEVLSDGDEGHEIDSPRSFGEISENIAKAFLPKERGGSAEGQNDSKSNPAKG